MKTQTLLYMFMLLSVLVSCKGKLEKGVVVKQPNIIYILADDLGYGDLSCFGQTKFETPNIDRLAKEGMMFTRHYAGSTVCAPSRSSLMTGQHTGHTQIRGNLELPTEGQLPLHKENITIAEVLKGQGYITGAFGKWGLGFINSEGDPNNQGFDQFYGYNCQRQAHRYYPTHLWENDKKIPLEGNDYKHKVTFSPDKIHDKALEFIQKNKDTSFFMYYPSVMPHAEIIMPDGALLDKFRGRYKETPFVAQRHGADYGDEPFIGKYYCSQPEPRATFAAMIALLDQHVGEVVQQLKDLGIDKNTIIVFSSDNGPHKEGGADSVFFNSNGSLRGVKRDLYEGGVRVPMIARWPGKIKPNTTSDYVSAFWDMMPTFAELSSAPKQKNIDGISLLPILLGGKQTAHDFLYWEFPAQGGKQAVLKGKWKAVRLNISKGKMKHELYNLLLDPKENNDVSDAYPEVLKDLKQIMNEQHTESLDYKL